MRTLDSTLLRVPETVTEEAPGPDRPARNSPNLARPWKFPAGHDDFIMCRRHARSPVRIPVVITLFRRDGSTHDRGTGVIQNLSYSGLWLSNVLLTRGRLLADRFAVELRHAQDAPAGHDVAGRILRTYSLGFPGFGIEFLFPGSGAEARLRTPHGTGIPAVRSPG